MAIAGRVAIVPKGDWSANATYKRLDAVTYNNTLYFAKKEVPAGTATSNTEYWSKSIVGGKVKSIVKNGSITEDKVQPNFLADIKVESAKAVNSATNAKASETNAAKSATDAKYSADRV